MRQVSPLRRMRSSAVLAIAALAASAALAADECRIDRRFAAPRAEVLLASPAGHQAVVTPDGGLRFADGSALSVATTGELAFSDEQPAIQSLLGGRLPIVTTARQSDKLAMELTAFVAAAPPTACLRVVLRNKSGEALSPAVRVRADNAHGTLSGKHAGFVGDGGVFALCELREGKGEIVAAAKPKRSVFRHASGRAMANWAHPKGACDGGFRNIVAGMAEPATFLLKVEPKGRYVLAVGLCESHWREPGNRICDILIEGRKVATVDPVKLHGPDVPFVLTFPATDRDGDGWIAVTSVANTASPDVNSIVNVIWLFEEGLGKGLSPEEIVSGRASGRAHCYIDCGGGASAPGPAVLDYRIDLPAGGSATLWLKKPFDPVRGPGEDKLAALDPAKLLAACEQAWQATLSRGLRVELADPAPADILYASLANLLSMRTRDADGLALGPGAPGFGASYSPSTAALGAIALDRMGFGAEAAEVLAGLAARRGDDRLWADGPDRWTPTGQALWALLEHHELTRDAKWLAANYHTIFGSAEALIEARQLTKWVAHDPADPSHGLMPATACGALPQDYWFVHDLWAWQGLRFAAQAAAAMGKTNECKWLEDYLADHAACLKRSILQSRVDSPAAGCLPAAAGEASAWTYAACVPAVYPAQALADDDCRKLLAETYRYLDKNSPDHVPCGVDGSTGPVDVPLACQYALSRLARGDAEAALGVFAAIANVAPPTGGLPQRADLRARRPSGLAPSAAAAAGYVLLLRDMLIRQDTGELHLCSCVPRAWLAKPLAVTDAPTTLGPVTYRATLAPDGRKLVVELTMPKGASPAAVVVHAPLGAGAVQSARCDCGQARVAGQTVRVTGWKDAGKIEIEFAQTQAP